MANPAGSMRVRLWVLVPFVAIVGAILGAYVFAHARNLLPSLTNRAVVYRTPAQLRANGEALPTFLRKKIQNYPTGELPMGDWIAFLRDQGSRICFEGVKRPRTDKDLPIAVPLREYTLDEFLDELMILDDWYRWEWVEGTDIINVVPKFSRLAHEVGAFHFQDKALEACAGDPRVNGKTQLALGPHRIGSRTRFQDVWTWPFDMDVRRATHRDYLNLLAAQYDGMTWQVTSRNALAFYVPVATHESVIDSLNRDETAHASQGDSAARETD